MATIYRKAPEGRGHSRPGDEWRTTYHSMALTNLVVVVHLFYAKRDQSQSK